MREQDLHANKNHYIILDTILDYWKLSTDKYSTVCRQQKKRQLQQQLSYDHYEGQLALASNRNPHKEIIIYD